MTNSTNNQQNTSTENVCYSCGQPAYFIVTKQLKPCCSNHYNKCPAKRRKNSLGGKKVYAAGIDLPVVKNIKHYHNQLKIVWHGHVAKLDL